MIKLSDAKDLGENIVVQGGTFYNDAVLRSFEKIAGVHATRPDIAGIMGAFGAALIARERHEAGYQTTMLSIEQINKLSYTTKLARCQGCTNHCLLTINKFSDNRQYITGNRCERGLGKEKTKRIFQTSSNIRTNVFLLMNLCQKPKQPADRRTSACTEHV